jgi:hypothetical protein
MLTSKADLERAVKLKRELSLRRAIEDCAYWLLNHTKTEDEQDPEDPLKSFPDREYFWYILDVLNHEPTEFIEKSRTMMLSWLLAGYAIHKMCTRPFTTVVVQSKDEARAVKPIHYMKCLWRNSDQELKDRWPMPRPWDKQPFNKVELSNGSWALGVSGDPDRIRSEHPTIVLLDEGAFIDTNENYNVAVATRCKQIIVNSSANPGWFYEMIRDATPVGWPDYSKSQALFGPAKSMLDNLHVGSSSPIPGLGIKRTAKGIPVIRVHYSADPLMTGEKLAAEKARYSSDSLWLQEMEIDYEARSGALIYPEFDEQIHVVSHSRVPRVGTRHCSIDPHPRTPHAVLWVVIDQWNDWYVYRELWPSVVYASGRALTDNDEDNFYTVKDYSETIATLEGNRLEFQHGGTDKEYARYIRQQSGERIVYRFMDQAGKAFRASGESQLLETYARRYARYGIRCVDLLKSRKHDTFGAWSRLHISDRCPELIHEFKNQRYKVMKSYSDEKELKQDASEARCHLIDNLRYMATSRASFIARLVSSESIRII